MEQLNVRPIGAERTLRLTWDELPVEGSAAKLHYRFDGEEAIREVLLVRRADGVFALDSLCPHSAGRLAEGPLIDGENVHCPLHLYKFCPTDGHAVEMDCAPATVHPLVQDDDGVRVDLSPADA